MLWTLAAVSCALTPLEMDEHEGDSTRNYQADTDGLASSRPRSRTTLNSVGLLLLRPRLRIDGDSRRIEA